jgi:hypothetical protein
MDSRLDVRSLVGCPRLFSTRRNMVHSDRMAHAEHSGMFLLLWPVYSEFHAFSLYQIIYLTLALFIFALISTYIARRRPRGPQPAAYGHLQTLANLVDEWSSAMWWGHKSDDKVICHAGELFDIFVHSYCSLAYP